MEEIDRALEARRAELAAHDDETGDGRIDAADLKAQMDRIEAQLELQDRQNRSLLRSQRIQLALVGVIAVVLLAAAALLWSRTSAAYEEILAACAQVNGIAATLQQSLDTVDPAQLDALMQDLPAIAAQLKSIDVDALNAVLEKLPALMDDMTALQAQVDALAETFSGWGAGLGALFGGLG